MPEFDLKESIWWCVGISFGSDIIVGEEILPFSDSKITPEYRTDFFAFPIIKFEPLDLFYWKAL
jgi:hypothetical protein